MRLKYFILKLVAGNGFFKGEGTLKNGNHLSKMKELSYINSFWVGKHLLALEPGYLKFNNTGKIFYIVILFISIIYVFISLLYFDSEKLMSLKLWIVNKFLLSMD